MMDLDSRHFASATQRDGRRRARPLAASNGLLLLACVTALTGAAAARAQPADGRSVGGTSTLEEITITSRKLEETQQSAPAAVTAYTGDTLVQIGVLDLRGAQNFVPSVRFQAENASTEIYVRGVGSTLDLPNIDPPTSFHFNGVYIPREGTSVGFYDLARLELLPGTQGTLYGRSSLGGVVDVSFNRPTREYETSGVLEAGNYSLLHGTVVQNLPLTDSLAVRAAVDFVDRDGYLATGADGANDLSGRLSALYAPSDAVELYWWANYASRNGAAPNLVRRGYNGGRFDGDPEAFDHADPWDDRISPTAPNAGDQDYENLVTGAELTLDLGGLQLSYLPAYFHLDWNNEYWLEDIPAFLSAKYDQLTQELRLSNAPGDSVQWLAGLYAYRMTNAGDFIVGGFPLTKIERNRLEGYAAFGQATFPLAERTRFTAGARASFDAREGAGTTPFGERFDADEHYDRVDWKLSVEHDVAADSLLYGTVQTGYQPGTYNPFPSSAARSNLVQPAKLTAWTLGSKNRFLDDRVQANVEVYYYDYRDLFVQSFNLNTALLTTFNAAQVEIYGSQLDLLVQASTNGRLNVSVGYLHARFDEFVVPADIDIGTPQRDYAGYQLQYAPDWTVSAGYQHDFPLGRGYLRARADTRYESEFWGTFTHARGTRQPGYFKSDASLTFHAADEAWSAGLWIRNVENEAVLAATTTGQFGPYADAFIEPPRTYGARVTFRF
jgi:iron complex outermembrane receptor protein